MTRKKVMPANIRTVVDEIQKDVLELHYRWKAFKELYGSYHAVEVLNYTSANLFLYIYDAMLSDTISSISRLMDNKTVFHKETLGFKQLANLLEHDGCKNLLTDFNKTLEDTTKKAEKIRSHRNKRVSHADLDLRISEMADKLPDIPVKEFEDTLSGFRTMLNMIEKYFEEIPLAYSAFEKMDSAGNLLYKLGVAKKVLESPDRNEILIKVNAL